MGMGDCGVAGVSVFPFGSQRLEVSLRKLEGWVGRLACRV